MKTRAKIKEETFVRFKITLTNASWQVSPQFIYKNTYLLTGRVIKSQPKWRGIGRHLVEVVDILSKDEKGCQLFTAMEKPYYGKQYWVPFDEVLSQYTC
jgi:hypothetical protein